MNRDDAKKDAMPNVENRPRLTGFTPEAEEWMRNRTAAFQRYTQRRGRPLTYGTGVPPAPKKKGRRDG